MTEAPEPAYKDILSTTRLAEALHNKSWVLIDTRFDLSKPDWGLENYLEGHIPGAIYASLDKDLAGPVSAQTGRHPLPDTDRIADTFTRWGISMNETQVVAYDTLGGAYAVRLWWMLRYYGHEKVAILDGGYTKWLHENLPVERGSVVPVPASRPFQPVIHPVMLATVEDVSRIDLDPAYRLVDARAPQRYRGEIEPIDPVAGHIPGAVNRFHGDDLSSEGVFKSPDELRSEFLELLQGVPSQNAVIYCGSGITSCFHLLAMELAGLKGARLYAGSWSEWIRDPRRPVAKETGS